MVEINLSSGPTDYSKVDVYEQTQRDVAPGTDDQSQARDIGRLRLNRSRLNAFSRMGDGNTADYFSFAVDSNGPARLGFNLDDGLRLQILDPRGRVFADSNEDAGAAYEQFLAMTEGDGTYDLKKGERYAVKVSRVDERNTKDILNFSIQLHMGDSFYEDYDTIEYSYTPPVDENYIPLDVLSPPSVSAGQGIANMLNNALVSFLDYLNGTRR